jgi:hypothetical protein
MTLPETTAALRTATAPGGISTINPVTGLSTDYLNHFTEAIMVLEMASAMPECLEDLRSWRPKTYCEHFETSRFSNRDAFIAAYETAHPAVRAALDEVAETLNAVLVETRDVFLNRYAGPDREALALRALSWIKPLVARAAAVINGRDDSGGSQAKVDALLAQ